MMPSRWTAMRKRVIKLSAFSPSRSSTCAISSFLKDTTNPGCPSMLRAEMPLARNTPGEGKMLRLMG